MLLTDRKGNDGESDGDKSSERWLSPSLVPVSAPTSADQAFKRLASLPDLCPRFSANFAPLREAVFARFAKRFSISLENNEAYSIYKTFGSICFQQES